MHHPHQPVNPRDLPPAYSVHSQDSLLGCQCSPQQRLSGCQCSRQQGPCLHQYSAIPGLSPYRTPMYTGPQGTPYERASLLPELPVVALPYRDPRLPESADRVAFRATERFCGAVLWAILILLFVCIMGALHQSLMDM